MHLERLLDKANQDLALLRHMAFRYRVRNMSAQARIRSLKVKLRKTTRKAKEEKEQYQLRIMAEDSMAQHSTPYRTSSPNFKKFGEFLVTW